MRDPTRIPRILKRICKVWEQHPDWRLGQLIVNTEGIDPFYVEDEQLAYHMEVKFGSVGPQQEKGE